MIMRSPVSVYSSTNAVRAVVIGKNIRLGQGSVATVTKSYFV
jgi:hypothetical protein